MVFDVTEQDFSQRVLERSREIPVVVDFWAEWCGPCRQLGPALERAANAREGRVELAKLDVDGAPRLSQAFRIQGIPAVKAFRDDHVADEFTGAIPPAEVERFFDRLVPSDDELRAQAAVESGDEDALREAMAANPKDATVAAALGRLLLARGDAEEALALLEPFEHDFLAAGLAARARLTLDGEPDLDEPFAAWDRGDHAAALEQLQSTLAATADAEQRDALRRAMIAIFTELGPQSELAREHRRRLAAVLN